MLNTLFLSTLLCFFSNSWLTIWVLLEMNTLSFCSLNFKKSDSNAVNTKSNLMKYLVIQGIASVTLILTGILKESMKSTSLIFSMIMVMSLMVKMAAAPFHFWFISVAKKSSWVINKILFTWQKMMPIYLILFQPKILIFPFILISSITGSIFLMNKKSVKEIMSLSSIFNLSWMLAAVSLNLKMLLMFSLIYWTSLLTFLKEVTKDKMLYFNEKPSQTTKVSLFLKTINLAGIPPFMMFSMKWMVFYSLLKINMLATASLILILSSVNVFIYLRLTSVPLSKNSTKEQKFKNNSVNYKTTSFLLMNILILQVFF